MTLATPEFLAQTAQQADAAVLDIAIPVCNEADRLEAFIRRTHAQLTALDLDFIITVIDCGSTDRTLAIAERTARELKRVTVLHTESSCLSEGMKKAWEQSKSVVFMHLDPSQSHDVSVLRALIEPLLSGKAEVSVGVATEADEYSQSGFTGATWRGIRDVVLRAFTGDKHLRARSGLLAMRAEFARLLLPYLGSADRFADTELLILAQRSGLTVAEVPVELTCEYANPGESATADIRGAVSLRRRISKGEIQLPALRTASASLRGEPASSPLFSFATVGVSTLLMGLLVLAV